MLVKWILVNNCKVSSLLHYLDDFITAAPPPSPYSPQCAQTLSTALLVCDRLGLPLHPGKCVGPTLVLTVRCIDLDSLAQVARLPEGADSFLAASELLLQAHTRIFHWKFASCG